MKKVFVMLLLGMLVFGVGCTKVSLDVQRSGLRASGDLGSTLMIEKAGKENWKEWQKETSTIAVAVLKWLKTGEIDKMTGAQLAAELKKIVPARYWSLVDMAIDALDNVKSNPGDLLGIDNVKRLIAFWTGVQNGAVLFEGN